MCNGNCNQGRNCNCGDTSWPFDFVAGFVRAMLVVIAAFIVALAVMEIVK